MPYVNSSAIDRIEWSNGTLTIWFTNKHIGYEYPNVPENLYIRFLNSASKGEFYNDHIREQYGD